MLSKFSAEEKTKAVMRHIKDGESFRKIASSLGIEHSVVRTWCRNYEVFGSNAFLKHSRQNYSLEFKEECVKWYLAGNGSLADTCRTFKIPQHSMLRSWISLYNGHKLKASPGGGLIMTKGRKTTIEERISIVETCIKDGMNYEKTAELFEVSYQQVYLWVHKYQEKGVVGLEDRRGKAKHSSEMSDVGKLLAENKLLKAQLERTELENKFLKKVKEIEGRRC